MQGHVGWATANAFSEGQNIGWLKHATTADPGETGHSSDPAQQLRLFRRKLLVGQNSLPMQFGEAFKRCGREFLHDKTWPFLA